jgi:hypothetical protein
MGWGGAGEGRGSCMGLSSSERLQYFIILPKRYHILSYYTANVDSTPAYMLHNPHVPLINGMLNQFFVRGGVSPHFSYRS